MSGNVSSSMLPSAFFTFANRYGTAISSLPWLSTFIPMMQLTSDRVFIISLAVVIDDIFRLDPHLPSWLFYSSP